MVEFNINAPYKSEIDRIDSVGPVRGLVREGTILSINVKKGTVNVGFSLSKSDFDATEYTMDLPASWQGPNGEFSGGYPIRGATVRCALGQGGKWTIIGYVPSNDVFSDSNFGGSESFDGNLMATLRPGRWLTQVRNNIRIFCDPNIGVQAGGPDEYLHLDPNKDIMSNTFAQNMSFTEGNQIVVGQVRRDLATNSNRNQTSSALSGHEYQNSLTEIGLDPRTSVGDAVHRNPAFVEKHEIVYEFERSFGFTNDKNEIAIYDNKTEPSNSGVFERQDSRADILSLSLEYPNNLIEKVEGTLVDLYGNILDLNRSVLPSGTVDSLSLRDNENNQSDTFLRLRDQARRSVAYHWELNARKDLGAKTPDVNDRKDYQRQLSRAFIDIDKEGQFKASFPMSSETGNVPVLTRYENYSTIRGQEEEANPRAFVKNSNDVDIFLTEYGRGEISIDTSSDTSVTPQDRITETQIQLGTAYHFIETDSLVLHKREEPISRYLDSVLNEIPPITEVISPTVTAFGENANAGGRSGTISLDGSMNISVGANTSDRQSLWIDYAGGIVANVGRDKRNVSCAYTLDGDLLIQVGGPTISNDSRFSDLVNSTRDGIVDIRVVNNAQMHVIRIDSQGMEIYTPQRLDIVSEKDLRLRSVKGNIVLSGESILMYSDLPTGGILVNRTGPRTI